MMFHNIQTDFNFIFGQFSVTRKLILNGGAIRPTCLLLHIMVIILSYCLFIVVFLLCMVHIFSTLSNFEMNCVK